jgi:hypothetical protein
VDAGQTIRNYPGIFNGYGDHYETCRGVHLISWRTFWALVINVLFQL